MVSATQALNVARSQVGYREGNRNDNKYGIWYGWNNQPYCAMGLSWVFANTPGGLTAIGGKWAYCPYWANWFRSKKRFSKTPHRGDIVFFDWSGLSRPGRESHVGIVEEAHGNYVKTIEFNTVSGTGNQSDGGGVYMRTRHLSLVVGFGMPYYVAETNVIVIPSKNLPLAIDGVWGALTTKKLQKLLGVTVDGEMGPNTYRAMSIWLGEHSSTVFTLRMKTALQHRVGVSADGIIGPVTVRAFQKYLNRNA